MAVAVVFIVFLHWILMMPLQRVSPFLVHGMVSLGSVLLGRSKKSLKTCVHKQKIQARVLPFVSSFPTPRLSPRGGHPDPSVSSWEMVKGSHGACRRVLAWQSRHRGCWGLFHVGTRVIELVGAVCCFFGSRGTDIGRALAKRWSSGYIYPPPPHFFN